MTEADLVPGPTARMALFTDLYELTMMQSYYREGMRERAVFELFFRSQPETRNFAVAAGLDSLLAELEELQFHPKDLEYLAERRIFTEDFLQQLRKFRFTGDLFAVPEGTVVFPNEPLVQVVAPLPEAQIVETLVLNQIQFATLAASKAARMVLASGGRSVIDFGSRRAHGTDAALTAARSAYLAGADGTSLVEAGRRFGIPIYGTMAHSYIQAFDDEMAAMRAFVDLYPQSTLLVDTYDTLRAVEQIIDMHQRQREHFTFRAIRLDSGDLAALARRSREMLDQAGLHDVQIVASGGLDEFDLERFARQSAPIDGYGIGTSLAVSSDAPSLDIAYKLVEYDGRPRTKLSASKVVYPGRKQIFRQWRSGKMDHDVLAAAGESTTGEPLLIPVMKSGKRLPAGYASLSECRRRAQAAVADLPEPLRQMGPCHPPYTVKVDRQLQTSLEALRSELEASR